MYGIAGLNCAKYSHMLHLARMICAELAGCPADVPHCGLPLCDSGSQAQPGVKSCHWVLAKVL